MDKTTVGIVTWHRYHNYGGVLQAYATQQLINSLGGYKAKIINYYYPGLLDTASFNTTLLYPNGLNRTNISLFKECYRKDIENRVKNFENFINLYLDMTEPYYDVDSIYDNPPEFDIYLSGSDQIWNFSYEYLYQEMYGIANYLLPNFLGFTKNKNKIAFSCGMSSYHQNEKSIPIKYISMINDYKNIMLREKTGVDLISKYMRNKNIYQVLDPTLTLKKEEYFKLMKIPKQNEKYIFAYLFFYEDKAEEYENTLKILNSFANSLSNDFEKYKVILVTNAFPQKLEYIETKIDIGPAEWLGFIYNSQMVVTNSFHGTAFSIIFNKPFLCVGADERKKSLLDLLEIKDRFFENKKVLKISDFEIDYENIKLKLEQERVKAVTLLSSALKECE